MVYIGIDISKNSFNFCVIDENKKVLKTGSYPVSKDGFENFIKPIAIFDTPVILLESSSRYHITLTNFLISHNFPVYIVNPKAVNKFIKFKSPNNPSKSDNKDAFFIALFAKYESHNLKPYKPSNSLRLISRKIESINHEIAKTKTQIKQHLDVLFPELPSHVNVFSKSVLNLLKNFPSAFDIANSSFSDIDRMFYSPIGRKVSISTDEIINLAKNSIGVNDKAIKICLVADIEKLLFLENQLKELESVFIQQMKDFFCEDIEIVSSICGVSEYMACMFIAEIGRKKAMIAVVNKLVRVVFAMLSNRQCFSHPALISNT